jgi:hypothetical protein
VAAFISAIRTTAFTFCGLSRFGRVRAYDITVPRFTGNASAKTRPTGDAVRRRPHSGLQDKEILHLQLRIAKNFSCAESQISNDLHLPSKKPDCGIVSSLADSKKSPLRPVFFEERIDLAQLPQ